MKVFLHIKSLLLYFTVENDMREKRQEALFNLSFSFNFQNGKYFLLEFKQNGS